MRHQLSFLCEGAALAASLDNCLSPAMIASLATSKPQAVTPLRTVALGSGDEAIGGTPLWLRAEPGEDAAMAEAMAADIAAWSRTCGIS